MKKLLLLLTLFITVYVQATLVPKSGTLYNIKQSVSGLVVGGIGTKPCLQAINQKPNQAFSFVPVSGATDTYYLLNQNGEYLNQQSAVSWDNWSVDFGSAINSTRSEWVISDDASGTGIRLKVNSNAYLASDNTAEGAGIYCDKAIDNVNGVFLLEPASVVYQLFEIAEKELIPQIEKNVQPYPIHLSISGVSDNIYATPTTGFSIDKSEITPDDMQAGKGTVVLKISTTAPAGTVGKIYFAVGSNTEDNRFDSLTVTSIDKQPRYFFVNASDTTKVMGSHTTSNAPAIQINTGDITQKFLLRPVNSGVNDSLFYILQDVDYKMVIKDITSNYDVIFGSLLKEGVWKITKQENGVTSSIQNMVTGKFLAPDALDVDSRIYDDKTFTPSPTAGPYCEWKVLNADLAVVPELFSLSDNNQILPVEKSFQSYPITITSSGIKQSIKMTASAGFTLDKQEVTPEQLLAGLGNAKVRISTSTQVGTTGTIVFYTDKAALDTVQVISTAVSERYYIQNNLAAGLVIGNHLTVAAPALTSKIDDITQKFIIRPVNPTLEDSLYYIIQDGDYQMMKKSPSNAWDVVFGNMSSESIWKIDKQIGRAYVVITNKVSGFVLGTDDIVANSRLYDDKTFVENSTSKPFCEWSLVPVNGSSLKLVDKAVLFTTVSDQSIHIHGTKAGDQIRVYNVVGQMVQSAKAESSLTTVNVKTSGMYLIQVNATLLKVVK